MKSSQIPNPATPQRTWIAWAITGLAFLLGLIAVIVVIEGLRGSPRASDPWTNGLNLLTGLAGIGGAAGYGLRKRWGVAAFGLSVLGHFVAHLLLMASAIAHQRGSIFSLGGLSVIPVMALLVWLAMVWESRRRSPRLS